jgi:hypothetical protein
MKDKLEVKLLPFDARKEGEKEEWNVLHGRKM